MVVGTFCAICTASEGNPCYISIASGESFAKLLCFCSFLESEGGCPMCGTVMPAHSVSRLEGDQVKQALAIAAGLQSTQDSGATNNENSSNE